MTRPSLAAFVFTLFLAAALAGPHVWAGDRIAFVTAIDDLPLMPGLIEASDDAMVFDAPAGRIVEAYASGAVSRNQVLEFYARTLPQLGWQRAGDGRFRREGEILKLEFPDGGAQAPDLTVRFALSPARAGSETD